MTSPSTPLALILSAGASQRMGRPKALLPWNTTTVIEAHIHAYSNAGYRVCIVLGAQRDLIQPFTMGAEVVVNENWANTEMRHSALLGLNGRLNHNRVALLPVDTPPLNTELLKTSHNWDIPGVVSHNRTPGHPLIASVWWLKQTLSKGPLNAHLKEVNRIEVQNSAVLETWNTPDEWRRYHKIRGTNIHNRD
jgi:CTP:molybdopterin cytidylyltransferase MocA